MFIDRARIRVIAGDGGNGCLAFRRETFIPRGGPSGGDGGDGGNVFIECSDRVNTLLHFQYKRVFKAQRGRHGEGSQRRGRNGEDVVILVPPGTQVYREPERLLVHDFARCGERLLVASGGRGRGTRALRPPPTRPRRADPGSRGRRRSCSSTSSSSPTWAWWDTRTRASPPWCRASVPPSPRSPITPSPPSPSPGVVQLDDFRSFVVADIPGLIEGPQGARTGDQFLKHVERTRVLVHLVDVSNPDRDPWPPTMPSSRN